MTADQSQRTEIDIALLNPAERSTAEAVLALLRVAHAQESALLHGADAAPALQSSLDEVQASRELHLGAFLGNDLAGLLCVGPGDAPGALCISTLVVHPAAQRQGVARALVSSALTRMPGAAWSVVAAAGNAPALALYADLGFVVMDRGSMALADGTGLAVLRLLRRPSA